MSATHAIRRRHYTREQREDFVVRFRSSGLSLSEFARRNNLKLPTLYQWIQQGKPGPGSAAPVFQEILLSPSRPSPAWTAELSVGSDLILRLGSATTPEFLAQLLQQLRRSC